MKGIRIRPEKQGLKATLFDLEAAIMDIVWSMKGDEFAVSDVHRALERTREIAYTTVMTTVDRLFKKELLARRKEGRRYLYLARLDRKTFHRQLAREVMDSLPPAGQEVALAMLVDQVSEADADTLDRLEALICARREVLDDE